MQNPLAEYGIYLEEDGDYEIGNPPFCATNVLLQNGYAVQIRSGLDEDGELYFNLLTLVPDGELMLSAQQIDDLDLSKGHVNGDEPFYAKDNAIIEMLDTEELVAIINQMAKLEPAAKAIELKAMITRNCYVVNQEVREKPRTFPITQFGDQLFDPSTSNESGNATAMIAAAASAKAGVGAAADTSPARAL